VIITRSEGKDQQFNISLSVHLLLLDTVASILATDSLCSQQTYSSHRMFTCCRFLFQ